MFRTTISLLLVVTQMALAPLYVCTSAEGHVRLDCGAAYCVSCQPKAHEHQHRNCCSESPLNDSAPCDCRHEPLCEERQQVQRIDVVPSGELLVAPLANLNVEGHSLHDILRASGNVLAADSHTPLADRGSVCLRC
jgi:hypothetical protein